MTATELFDIAQEHRRNRRFGDAINIYMEVVESPDATDELRRTAAISIELIQEINGFVNVDLLNP
jgi:hypothetical protein